MYSYVQLSMYSSVPVQLSRGHHAGPPGLRDPVLDADTHPRKRLNDSCDSLYDSLLTAYLDDLLNRALVREGEHDGCSRGQEELKSRVLKEI